MIEIEKEMLKLRMMIKTSIFDAVESQRQIDTTGVNDSNSFALLSHLRGATSAAQSLERLAVGCDIPKRGD